MIGAAVILAGGRGSRLAPWDAPKCLMPVGGVTLIDRIIDHISPHVHRAVICTGYRADDVAASVQRGMKRWQPATDYIHVPRVVFSNAGEDTPMGERLLRARSEYKLESDRLLVLYGDEMADVDIRALEKWHEAKEMRITFTAYRQKLPFGVVLEDDRISEEETALVNIGFVLTESSAWAHLRPEDGVSDWINRVPKGSVALYLHEGRRATVNSIADLRAAEEVWK